MFQGIRAGIEVMLSLVSGLLAALLASAVVQPGAASSRD